MKYSMDTYYSDGRKIRQVFTEAHNQSVIEEVMEMIGYDESDLSPGEQIVITAIKEDEDGA